MIKILIFLVVSAFTSNSFSAEVKTIDSLELDRYLGRWYEIASIAQSFQKKCASNTQAEYSLVDNDQIKVLNSCDTIEGTKHEVEGRAKIVDKKSNAKLKVTFVKFMTWLFPLGGDYWVLDLAPDYSYALVGEKSREYAWILSRTQALGESEMLRLYDKLKENGYDTCKVLTSIQEGQNTTRTPLCEIYGG